MLFQTIFFVRVWIKIPKCILNATTFNCRWQKCSLKHFSAQIHATFSVIKSKTHYAVYSMEQLFFLGLSLGLYVHAPCLFVYALSWMCLNVDVTLQIKGSPATRAQTHIHTQTLVQTVSSPRLRLSQTPVHERLLTDWTIKWANDVEFYIWSIFTVFLLKLWWQHW